MIYPTQFDVIVIGGGHAGTEACLAAARMGCKNPAADPQYRNPRPDELQSRHRRYRQSHLVREIDALGGLWRGRRIERVFNFAS